MNHAAEGALQAYLDGEIDSAAVATLRAHLASCGVCASELEALRAINQRAHSAFAWLDTPAPMLRARVALATAPRHTAASDARGFLKAALLLLALAGAGGAMIPGSPLRPWLQHTFARVAQLFGAGAGDPIVDHEAAAPDRPTEVSGFGVAAANGRVRVVLVAPHGDVTVSVRTTDDALVRIDTRQEAGTVRIRSATGRAELSNVANGAVTIGIPRTVTSASIEIDGIAYVFKRNGRLVRTGQMATTSGARVRFDIEE